jgi:SAM-dependent methyltransferase
MTFERAKEVYDGDDVKQDGPPRTWGGFWELLHQKRLELLTRVLEDIGVDESTTMLDVGSGQSMLSDVVEAMGVGSRITAFDVSATAIEKGAKKHPDTEFLVDDAQDPKLEGQWDVVFAGEIIEHLPQPGLAFQRWNERVVPGGHLVVSTPNAHHNIFTEEHISLQTPAQMMDLYSKNGLELIGYVGADLVVPVFRIGPFLKIGVVKAFNNMLASGRGEAFVRRYIECIEDDVGMASDIFYWGKKAGV